MPHERALRAPSNTPHEARKEGADLHTRGGTNCSTKPARSQMNEGGGTAGLEEQKGTHRTESDKLLQAFLKFPWFELSGLGGATVSCDALAIS